MKAVWLAANSE